MRFLVCLGIAAGSSNTEIPDMDIPNYECFCKTKLEAPTCVAKFADPNSDFFCACYAKELQPKVPETL